MMQKIEDSGKPVVAAINGSCLGGGLEVPVPVYCTYIHVLMRNERRKEGRKKQSRSYKQQGNMYNQCAMHMHIYFLFNTVLTCCTCTCEYDYDVMIVWFIMIVTCLAGGSWLSLSDCYKRR